jgi:hemolysin activation/secretion protein/AraC-like DNA-binding protein
MAIERHLILQELTLVPSGEWKPSERGWVIARVAEGIGYLLPGGSARELNAGDGFVAGFNANIIVRASTLGPLKLQFFTVQPQYLNGLLTMTEWHQLESASENPLTRVLFFTASEPLGQKFARIAAQTPTDGLTMRCTLLQLWTSAATSLIGPVSAPAGGNKLRERFRQMIGQLPEARLSECSLSELAGQLHCSERHFSRLFREEFGVPFRARQIELRLLHARQLLANSDAKIINVAYDSGYRHLGLFNAMFKKRFGVTPSEWRRQNLKKENGGRGGKCSRRPARAKGILTAVLGIFFALGTGAQTNATVPTDSLKAAAAGAELREKMRELDERERKPGIHVVPVSTNGPYFSVDKYLIMGNSVLSPGTISGVLTNVPAAYGTNVTFDAIRAALADLQMAYRERGYVTVSVGLPQQKLTNATVKVKVAEGRLAAINVTGNRYFSSNNVMRALPSLHTNMLLNSHVLQRELDVANASRDRQIYPVIGPGPEPDTSELTLKVKDQLPLHARLELNNQATPNTPDLRANLNLQYDNLWNLEHQIGLQYSCAFEQFKAGNEHYVVTPLDDPLIANYSGYYRLPLGDYNSVQDRMDANPGHFGYDEVTHKFNVPPATGRPELTLYATRSVSDTGVQRGPKNFLVDTLATNSSGVIYHPLSISTNSAGQNLTLNEGLGLKLSLPLPQMGSLSADLSFGADYKHFRQTSYNTNENSVDVQWYDQQGQLQTDDAPAPQPQSSVFTGVDYFPLNAGLNGSIADRLGTTFFNAAANFNVLPIYSEESHQITTTNIVGTNVVTSTSTQIIHGHSFSSVAYTTNAHPHYVTLQLGVDRVQTLYKDWSVKLHADGQWADGPLISNEQYGMGGTAGVRGYQDGQAYGDTGWRFSIEPQTRLFKIGMVGNEGHEEPCWVRASVFLDYGRIYLLAQPPPGSDGRKSFCGAGWAMTANIGSHVDGRLTVAWPLISHAGESDGVHIYFGVGAQF